MAELVVDVAGLADLGGVGRREKQRRHARDVAGERGGDEVAEAVGDAVVAGDAGVGGVVEALSTPSLPPST